ncbi:hypothetical protein BsWGS_05080 [Bradybaena similaris]
MSSNFPEEIADPEPVNASSDLSTPADATLNRRMLPTLGSAVQSTKYTNIRQLGMPVSSPGLAADGGAAHTPADRNYNYSSKKRPAMTISSSQPQSFRKKKVGFDAEQCGFLRINDIILTISGNMNKGYEKVAANAATAAFIKEMSQAKIQSQENRVNWSQLRKLGSPKETKNGGVSKALASYLQTAVKADSSRQPIEKQLIEIDNVIRSDSGMTLFSDQASGHSVMARQPPATGPTGLWKDLKKKGFKEVKHSKSLFEMLVPDDTKGEYRDLITRRKSALDPDSMFDNEDFSLAESNDSLVTRSAMSVASVAEIKPDSGKKPGQKKCVTIVDQDGTVYIPSENPVSPSYSDNPNMVPTNPLILISPPSVVFLHTQSDSDAAIVTSDMQESDKIQVSPKSSDRSRRLSVDNVETDLKVSSSSTDPPRPKKDVSDFTLRNSNSSNLSSRYSRSRNRSKEKAHLIDPVRMFECNIAAIDTGRDRCNVCNNNLQTDVVLLQWELVQAKQHIESLRRENNTLKTKMLQWTNTRMPDQKTHDLFSTVYGRSRRLARMLSYLAAITTGIILGRFVI